MVDYEYFMDRMADYELSVFLDNVDYAYVDEWEQTRILLWGLFKVNAGKNWSKKPSDLIPLVTDSNYTQHKNADELNDNEQDRLKNIFAAAAKSFENNEQVYVQEKNDDNINNGKE